MMHIIKYVFARLYGYMLGREYRNTPEDACRDAIAAYMIVIGVPTTLVVLAFLFPLFPRLLSSKDWIPWVTVPGGVALYFSTKPLQRYALTPEIATQFRSPESRRTTMIWYFGALVVSILVASIASRFFIRVVDSH
jgi:hypothetical protein